MDFVQIVSIIASVFALGLLIAFHELGHFWAARKMGMKVIRYSIGLLNPLFSWTSKRSGIVYQIGVLPFGGFVQVKGMNPYEDGAFEDDDSYQTKPVWRRMVVVMAGPIANLALAWVFLTGLAVVGIPEIVSEPILGAVIKDKPAEKAGLMAGDLIKTIDDKQVTSWPELAAAINAKPDADIVIAYERKGASFETTAHTEDSGGLGLIGIMPATRKVAYPILEAPVVAITSCFKTVGTTLVMLYGMITGAEEAAGVKTVGPVGIVKMAAEALQRGMSYFTKLLIDLSLMLFIFNLLPVPALDGGRSVVLSYELISRRRVNQKLDTIVNTVGFFLLIGAILAVTVKELFFG